MDFYLSSYRLTKKCDYFGLGIYVFKFWLKISQADTVFSFCTLRWHIIIQNNRNKNLFFKEKHSCKQNLFDVNLSVEEENYQLHLYIFLTQWKCLVLRQSKIFDQSSHRKVKQK